ncbi:MAG: Uma2 family endonuclease [Spirulinaceae cyanobacterium SM2_1_0]|nr:Uma2 family endonuclease [Spirulinaceae cyanobacterium SM2_1_0]
MIAQRDRPTLTAAEYLECEAQSPTKHEYRDGEIWAMAGTTDAHNTIALNIAVLLRNHLRGRDCQVYIADVKVRIEERNCFYYPDLLVTCEPRDRETPLYKCFPKLIIEVLSESTEAFDRGDKFNDYQTLDSLEEYVLVNTKHQRVEIFRRQEIAGWLLQTYQPSEASFVLQSLDLSLSLAAVYEAVNLEAAAATESMEL